MTACVIIPARFGSTRFPAKILAADTGKPLVQHVVEQARKCQRARDVLVATDDARIVEALRPFGTRTVMTSPAHQSGTDRIAEVAKGLEDEIVVNVQGDEPEIEPGTIDALIERLETTPDEMATAATPFAEEADPQNPNLVKVVISPAGHAIYFSRAAIPHYRDGLPPSPGTPGEGRGGGSLSHSNKRGETRRNPHPNPLPEYRERELSDRERGRSGAETLTSSPAYYLHLGIYAYRRRFLLEFASWTPTPLEQAEKLEQLRALEHGSKIYVLKVNRAVHGIDTAEQYRDFVTRYKGVVSS